MRASAFLYPWDVIGDPDAPHRLADLGVEQITLASAYHSTRAVTPRHPGHRIVTARHAAVYYPPDPRRWRGQALRPYPQGWVPASDAFAEAARALTAVGLSVHTWVVLAHNSRLGEEYPRITVRNAYGDLYPWAPCIAGAEARRYLVRLAAEAAVRAGAEGVELESCGWYGLAHLHAHDKTAGVALGGAAQYLMSLCFCPACRAGYSQLGADPDALTHSVRIAMAPLWAGAPEPDTGGRGPAAQWAAVERLLGAELAGLTLAHRSAVAADLQREAVRAIREAAGDREFRVMLHADPAPHACGANAGVQVSEVLAHADGLVLPCTGGRERRAALLRAASAHRRPGAALAANFTVVSGMGGRPGELAADAVHAAEHGATELRLYHAGLASDTDLAQTAKALAELRRA